MPDIRKNTINYSKYRYTITELLELSNEPCVHFDLSKFSYEAARAGVVPSLGDCAITSRKSSATCIRLNGIDSVRAEENLTIQENTSAGQLQDSTRTGPCREPYFPPPIDRQKDEGFARFLKKHSSPTHNRVTAGGRIVPMEPRSPPAFNLPPSIADHSRSVPDNQDYPSGQKTQPFKSRKAFDQVDHSTNPMLASSPLGGTGLQGNVGVSFNPIPIVNGAGTYNSPLNTHASFNTSAFTMPPNPFCHAYGMIQEAPAMMQPPSYDPQFGLAGYAPYLNAMSTTDMPYSPQNAGPSPLETYHYPYGQHLSDVPVLSTQQQLAAWQRHFADLDLQLKNIDRHRAMHHLDPNLAEQRRVIVQQRSDAKDTIQEYQGMLGLKRMSDSSQDSFTTGFNLDAPAYVPIKGFDRPVPYSQHGPIVTVPDKEQIFRSQGPIGCKAIPIKSPPKVENCEHGSMTKDSHKSKAQNVEQAKRWTSEKEETARNTEQKQVVPIQELEAASVPSQPQSNAQDWLAQKSEANETDLEDPSEELRISMSSIQTDKATNTTPSLSARSGHELQQVLAAIMQPRGFLSRVRLPDGTMIDVEGQGVNSYTVPPAHKTRGSLYQTEDERSQYEMREARQVPLSNDPSYHPATIINNITNKENISVGPMGHQKAATDAFLSQFNMIDDNMAFALKSETQSLHAISNRHQRTDSQGYTVPDMYRPETEVGRKAAGRQPLRNCNQQLSDVDRFGNNAVVEAGPATTNDFNHKGYSSISIQNIHAVGRLPQNLDGSYDSQQNAQARLSTANKAKSPRLLRRHGANGGAWYGPHCREILERALSPSKNRSATRQLFP